MKSQGENVSHTVAKWALIGLLVALVGGLRGWPTIVTGIMAAICAVVLAVCAIRWLVAHSACCANRQVVIYRQAEEENKH
jgi:uncharacterized membrane protein